MRADGDRSSPDDRSGYGVGPTDRAAAGFLRIDKPQELARSANLGGRPSFSLSSGPGRRPPDSRPFELSPSDEKSKGQFPVFRARPTGLLPCGDSLDMKAWPMSASRKLTLSLKIRYASKQQNASVPRVTIESQHPKGGKLQRPHRAPPAREKITKQTQFRINDRQSMGYGIVLVLRRGWLGRG